MSVSRSVSTSFCASCRLLSLVFSHVSNQSSGADLTGWSGRGTVVVRRRAVKPMTASGNGGNGGQDGTVVKRSVRPGVTWSSDAASPPLSAIES